jgi:hypothetical protein
VFKEQSRIQRKLARELWGWGLSEKQLDGCTTSHSQS